MSMLVTRVDFKRRRIVKPDDWKNCLNCAEYHDGLDAKTICLDCTRFGHTDGKNDNWKPTELE